MSDTPSEFKSKSEHPVLSDSRLPRPNNNRQGAAKIALITLFGLGATWFAAQQALTSRFSSETGPNGLDSLDIKGLKPQLVSGHVVKTLEQFSLTTQEGGQYHVADPNHIIDSIAKQRGIQGDLYDMNDVRIKGVISQVGNYGHLGRYERQIIVTGKV